MNPFAEFFAQGFHIDDEHKLGNLLVFSLEISCGVPIWLPSDEQGHVQQQGKVSGPCS
jgi:hypothetical protein